MEELPDKNQTISPFLKLLVALRRADVDYAVVGGVAVVLNNWRRFTEDADIIVSEKPENIHRLLETLTQWGEGWARELKPEEFVPQEGSFRVSEDFDLDIFIRMRGKSLEDFRPRLRMFETQDVRIAYLSPEDLIFLKQDSWRDKDKLDTLAMQEVLKREREEK